MWIQHFWNNTGWKRQQFENEKRGLQTIINICLLPNVLHKRPVDHLF